MLNKIKKNNERILEEALNTALKENNINIKVNWGIPTTVVSFKDKHYNINLIIDMLNKKYTLATKPIVDLESKAADNAFSISSDYIEFLENNIINISAKFFNTANAFDKETVKETKDSKIEKVDAKIVK